MVGTTEIQCQRLIRVCVHISLGDISGLVHLTEHDISSLPASLRIAYRIKIRWIFTHTYKSCRLKNIQLFRLLIKIGVGSRLYADGIMEEAEVIKIHRKYLLFGIVTFQFDGYHPLYRFLKHT